jgi:hypothetical protein
MSAEPAHGAERAGGMRVLGRAYLVTYTGGRGQAPTEQGAPGYLGPGRVYGIGGERGTPARPQSTHRCASRGQVTGPSGGVDPAFGLTVAHSPDHALAARDVRRDGRL